MSIYHSRKDALEAGALSYHGKACKNCGHTERYSKSRGCINCNKSPAMAAYHKKRRQEKYEEIRQKDLEYKAKNKDRRYHYNKKYREENAEAVRLYQANYQAKRRADVNNRTPSWADLDKIRDVYAWAKLATAVTGVDHHVDHVVPIKGKTVSGLHVENNLRVIPWWENLEKSNRHS
jgi:hypothetical protein